MPRFQDDAVVLRRFDWSETSQIAWVFTRTRGLVRGVAKGAKRPRSAFDGGLEPLTRGEIDAIVKPERELATFAAWDLREICWRARTSLEANRAGMFTLGLLASVVTDLDPHPGLFDALTEMLGSLESGRPPWAAALRFQWAALEETGHAPQLEQAEDDEVLGFDPQGGAFTEDPGRHGESLWRVRAQTVRTVRAVAAGDLAAPEAQDVRRANRFLLTYWTWTLGREPRVAAMLD